MFLALEPLPFIDGVINAVLACPMAQSIFDFSLESAAIGPAVAALAGDSVIGELALIDDAVSPGELAHSVEQSIIEVSLVPVPILEGDLSGAVEALAVDLAVLRAGGDFAFPVVVEYLGELDGQHHAVVHVQLYNLYQYTPLFSQIKSLFFIYAILKALAAGLKDIINLNVQNLGCPTRPKTHSPSLHLNQNHSLSRSNSSPMRSMKSQLRPQLQSLNSRDQFIRKRRCLSNDNVSCSVASSSWMGRPWATTESGLTVHLIARSNPPPENTPQPPQPQPQQPSPPQPQQRPPQMPPQLPFPPFGVFNMINPQAGFNNPQQDAQNPNQFAQSINSAVNNLMGSLGIRLPNMPNQPQPQQTPPQPPQPQQQQQPQQPQRPQQPQPQANPSPQSQPAPRVPAQNINPQMFRPLDQLEQNINRIMIMGEHTNVHANPRVNAINYLRRLQNNMLRFVPQLNRGIQLLQEGRTTHLPDLIEIFEALNASNTGALELLRGLTSEQPHHHHNHPHVHSQACNHPHPHPHQQQPQPMDVEGPEMTATIVIAEDQNNGQINVQMSASNANVPPAQPNILDTLSNFLQPGTGSGFNFANLFAQPPQPQQQAQQVPQQPQQSQSPQLPQPQQQQPQEAQRPQQPQQPQQPPNPLAGFNMMQMFSNLQQSGGMGALLGMSLGSMLEEGGQPASVYSSFLSPITGNEILTCFTQKDFSFFGRKREQFREAILKAISVAGSREDLENKYAGDLEKLLIPEGSVNNEEVCRKRVSKILHRHIGRVIEYFLDTSAELDLTAAVMSEIKTMYCEAIEEISKHTESIDGVFGNIKRGFVQSFDSLIPGFSGMLYALIERDMVRIYREYIAEKQRRQEMSAEEAQDEAELLKRIEMDGKEDAEAMAAFEHSRFYPI